MSRPPLCPPIDPLAPDGAALLDCAPPAAPLALLPLDAAPDGYSAPLAEPPPTDAFFSTNSPEPPLLFAPAPALALAPPLLELLSLPDARCRQPVAVADPGRWLPAAPVEPVGD